MLLLGHEDRPEAALADLLQQLVPTDHAPRRLGGGRVIDASCALRRRRLAQEWVIVLGGREQRLNPLTQLGVVPARAVQVCGPLLLRQLAGGVEDLTQSRKRIVCHWARPAGQPRSIASFNHARPNAHLRFTVGVDTPSAAAVSSTVSPAKKRSRTTLAAWGSALSKREIASSRIRNPSDCSEESNAGSDRRSSAARFLAPPRFGPAFARAWSTSNLDPKAKFDMTNVDEELVRRSNDFMERSVKAGKPFFLWHNTTRTHVWTHVAPKWQGKSGFGLYADAMMELDHLVGGLLKKVDDLGIADDTIVLFTSDNGAEVFTWPDGGNTPFRGEKGTTYEGGFRAPMLAKWPGVIKPGTIYNDIFSSEDWMPTLVAAAGDPKVKEKLLKGGHKANGKTFKNHLDGYNFLPFFKGEVDEAPRKISSTGATAAISWPCATAPGKSASRRSRATCSPVMKRPPTCRS